MLPIQKKFINYNFTPKPNRKIEYIIIHDTADMSATAQNEHDYFSGGDRQASADFFVDVNNIIQIIDYTKEYSWQVGDGHGKYGIMNSNSVGIEMCLVEPYDTVINNTIELVKYLMKELNIDINHVVRHFDASHKICPHSFSSNNWAKWTEFKNKLKAISQSTQKVQPSTVSKPVQKLQLPLNIVLKQGSKDINHVKVLQQMLNKLGFHCGIVDGILGNATKNSVISAQKKYKLTPDGIIGCNTIKKLNSLM